MTRHIRSFIIAIILVGCLHSSALALTNERIFSQFQFNFITTGARATAMGGAFIGLADDATAVESNPAGLTQLLDPEISAEFKYITYTAEQIYESYWQDIRRMEFEDSVASIPFVSVVYPYKRFVFSIYHQELVNYESSFRTSGSFITIPGLDVVILPIDASMELTVTNYGVGATVQLREGLSFAVSPRWSVMNMKSNYIGYFDYTDFSDEDIFYESQIYDDAGGFSVNAGVMWNPRPKISIGAVYRKGTKFTVTETIHKRSPRNSEDYDYIDSIPDFTLKVPDSFGIGVAIRPLDSLTFTIDVVHIQYKDLLEDFDPILKGPSEANISDWLDWLYEYWEEDFTVEYKKENFIVNNVTELHFGMEYLLTLGKRLLALRAGIYHEPDHTIRYTGTSGDSWADTFERVLFPGGDDDLHITGGVGLVVNEHFQIDTAANIADKMTQVSVSMLYRF